MPAMKLAAVAALATALAAPVQASTAWSTVTVSGVTINLIDLNLTDGVPATISFGSGATVDSIRDSLLGTYLAEPTALGWSTASGGVSVTESFSLSANSAVTFDIDFSLFATAAPHESCECDYEWSAATLNATTWGTGIMGTGFQSSSDSRGGVFEQLVTYSPTTLLPPGLSDSGTVQLGFANLSNNAIGGNVSVGVGVTAHGFTSAVPEPATYALMLLGLGMLGSVRRRQSR